MSSATPRRFYRRWLRWFGWFALAVALVVGLAALIIWLYLRASLPQLDGSAAAPGVPAPVEIRRDASGVAHIVAATDEAALYGLGYAHAQDRLWQMELQRRIARGALAEVLGEPALSTDIFLRTLGPYRAAEDAYAGLDAETKAQVDAYVAGINGFLAGKSGNDLPPEFTFLGFTPTPWTGADVLGWAKMMAWDLDSNYVNELLRADLAAQVGPERAAELMAPYPEDAPTIIASAGGVAPPAASLQPSMEPIAATRGLLTLHEEISTRLRMGEGIVNGIGSNNWVVAPSRTESGVPLLANDPHLGLGTPSIWYLASVRGETLNVTGGTIPGLPAVLSGHNGRIAWGVTTAGADVQDLYQERLDPSGTQVEYAGALEPLTIITETISVKDQPAIELQVRSSRHGPLISDALNAINEPNEPDREALALRWVALQPGDTTMRAFLGINRAQNWQEFTGALEHYVAPVQNFVYADVAGNIGYYAPGKIPLRAAGAGDAIVPGWDPATDWQGFVPFAELPQAYNPPSGVIVTANHKVTPADFPYRFGSDFAAPFRAERIQALLDAQSQLTLADMQRIQADQHSLLAERLLPTLLTLTSPTTDRQREALALLGSWNFNAGADSAPAAIFAAWNYYLLPPMLGDELDADALASYSAKRAFIDIFLLETLTDPASPWCDDITTPAKEDCAVVALNALEVALRDLTARSGTEAMAEWRWGDFHLAFFPHTPMDNVVGLRDFFSQAIGNGGDGSSVNVAPVLADQPFDQGHGPALRTVIDLANWDASGFITAPGQSGHPLSPHFDDLLAPWQEVRYIPMARPPAANDPVLRLEPEGGTQ